MDLFGLKRKKMISEEKERADRDLARDNYQRFKGLDLFQGSLLEYNQLKGEEHEIIDTGSAQKFIDIFIYHDRPHLTEYEQIKNLVEKRNCVGLIHYSTKEDVGWEMRIVGTPVRRKVSLEKVAQ